MINLSELLDYMANGHVNYSVYIEYESDAITLLIPTSYYIDLIIYDKNVADYFDPKSYSDKPIFAVHDSTISRVNNMIAIKWNVEYYKDLTPIDTTLDLLDMPIFDYYYVYHDGSLIQLPNLIKALAIGIYDDSPVYGSDKDLYSVDYEDSYNEQLLYSLDEIYDYIKYSSLSNSEKLEEYLAWEKIFAPIDRQGVILCGDDKIFGLIYDPTMKESRIIEARCSETIPEKASYFFIKPEIGYKYIDLF